MYSYSLPLEVILGGRWRSVGRTRAHSVHIRVIYQDLTQKPSVMQRLPWRKVSPDVATSQSWLSALAAMVHYRRRAPVKATTRWGVVLLMTGLLVTRTTSTGHFLS